jgi:hypothetical protein
MERHAGRFSSASLGNGSVAVDLPNQFDVRVVDAEDGLDAVGVGVNTAFDSGTKVLTIFREVARVVHRGIAALDFAILNNDDSGSGAERRLEFDFVETIQHFGSLWKVEMRGSLS